MINIVRIVTFVTLVSFATGQNGNTDVSFVDVMKIIGEIMQNINSNTTDFQATITKMLQNDTYINEILKQISFQGKPPSSEMVKDMMKKLQNLNTNSLQQLIGGGFDPMKSATSMFLNSNLSLACVGDLSDLVKPFMKAGVNPLELLGAPLASMVDSWGKPGAGILVGNLKWIGAMDQCEAFDQFRYCRTIFKFLGVFEGRWGTCFPKSCKPEDVEKVLLGANNVLQSVVTISEGQTMCNKPVEYSTGAIITILLLILIFLVALFGTIADILQNQNVKSSNSTPLENLSQREDQTRVDDDEKVILKVSSKEQIEQSKGNTLTNVLICFSIPRNIKALLSTKSPKGAIDCINGIRFISMTWVILGHYFFIGVITGTTDNMKLMSYNSRIFTFMPLANAYVAVDTFFLLSGLLVSYLALRRIDAKKGMSVFEYLIYLVHRYLRLTPSLIILMLVNSCLIPLFLTGPFTLEVRYWDISYKACQDYWWTNILYINNFWPKEMGGQCVGWVWYLANDWQFYVISPGILLLFYYWERKFNRTAKKYLGPVIITAILCTISFIITLTLIWKNDYPQLITGTFIEGNPRFLQAGAAQDNIYQKPYCRIPAYLVGLLLGYIFSRKIMLPPRLTKVGNFFGWSSAIVVALAIIYGPWHVFRIENQSFMTDAENIFYGTFHRFAWSVAVAWVIYACHNKMGGWINTFLSWKGFLPLSRMTYGAYLFHYLVLYYFFFISDRPNHIQMELVPYAFISSVVLSYGVAFIMSVFVELPIANLEKYLLG